MYKMKKTALFGAAIVFAVLVCSCAGDSLSRRTDDSTGGSMNVWLRRDWTCSSCDLPSNYRSMKTRPEHISLPSTTGLNTLRASGSAEFTAKQLSAIVAATGSEYKVIVVDLRQESHGFINDLPISWFMGKDQINWGKNITEIQQDEDRRLRELLSAGTATTYSIGYPEDGPEIKTGVDPVTLEVHTIATENRICSQVNAGYMRIPVADYQSPSDSEVDRFVRFVTSLDDTQWLHFHCEAGKGRTTTFLAMLDMMHNADKVSVEDIIARQHLLGGANLAALNSPISWKVPFSQERFDFVKKFHAYCKANRGTRYSTPWSQWRQ